jgi:hypothetical protein
LECNFVVQWHTHWGYGKARTNLAERILTGNKKCGDELPEIPKVRANNVAGQP